MPASVAARGPDRLPDGDRGVRGAGQDRPGSRLRLRVGRRHRGQLRRLRRRPEAVRVHRVPVRRLGRPARSRRRRRLQQLGRQLLQQPDRDHRGRAGAAHPPVRLRPGHRRRRARSGAAWPWSATTSSRRTRRPSSCGPIAAGSCRTAWPAVATGRRRPTSSTPMARAQELPTKMPPDRPQGRRPATPGGRAPAAGATRSRAIRPASCTTSARRSRRWPTPSASTASSSIPRA